MSAGPGLRVAELLAARLCHELISPISAVGNGIELFVEEGGDIAEDALSIAAESARRAAARLQFYRFAYGFSGEAETAGPPPFELAARYFEASAVTCDYREDVRCLPLRRQKLACNLLLVGAMTLLRGGRLILDTERGGLRLDITGGPVSLAGELDAALRLATLPQDLTPRTVQGYLVGLLARAEGWQVGSLQTGPGQLRLSAASQAA